MDGEAEGVWAGAGAGVGVGVGEGAAGVHLGGEVQDEVEGEEDGVGLVVCVPGVEHTVGAGHEEGEGIGGGAEHGGVEGGQRGGALAVAGGLQVEARGGCLE